MVQEEEEVEKQGAGKNIHTLYKRAVSDSVNLETPINYYVYIYIGIKILYAYYGLSCARGVLRKNVQVRSTAYAKRKCEGKQSCRALVHTRFLTDPYRGCAKDFIVVASCKNGAEIISSHVTREAQGKHFSLKCSGSTGGGGC